MDVGQLPRDYEYADERLVEHCQQLCETLSDCETSPLTRSCVSASMDELPPPLLRDLSPAISSPTISSHGSLSEADSSPASSAKSPVTPLNESYTPSMPLRGFPFSSVDSLPFQPDDIFGPEFLKRCGLPEDFLTRPPTIEELELAASTPFEIYPWSDTFPDQTSFASASYALHENPSFATAMMTDVDYSTVVADSYTKPTSVSSGKQTARKPRTQMRDRDTVVKRRAAIAPYSYPVQRTDKI